MRQVGASLALGICAGWVGFAFAGLLASGPASLGIGALLGALLALPLRHTVVSSGAMAVLAPFGVMLPALALRHAAVSSGVDIPGFSSVEIVIFLAIYTAFLVTGFGLLSVDLYRLGYAPVPVAIMTLALCLYALATGNWFLALVSVGGQAAWAAGWSSSNWFDTVLHVLLVPVAVIALLVRLF